MVATDNDLDGRPAKASSVNEEARDRQKAMLAALAKTHKLSLTDIAIQAGLSPSTLTRFVNDPASTTVLSGTTMARIEAAFAGFTEPDVELLADHDGGEALTPNQSIWRVGGTFVGLPGYLAGDFLLLDMAVAPQNGDDVLVTIDNLRGGGKTFLRKFRNQWAFGGMATDPDYVDNARVVVIGVILKSWRSRKA